MRTVLRPDLTAKISDNHVVLSSEYSNLVISTRDERVIDVIRRLDLGIPEDEVADWHSSGGIERKFMESLEQRGVLTSIPDELPDDVIASRQLLYLATVCRSPVPAQQKLNTARVAVIGVGGTGAAVMAHLVGAGVQNYVLVDYDRVELTNLNRQYIYTASDVGRHKVHAAADYVRNRAGAATVDTICTRVDSPEIAAELSRRLTGVDLAVVGIDTPAVTGPYWVVQALWDMNIASIYGSVGALSGLCTRIYSPQMSADRPRIPANDCIRRRLGHSYSFGPTNSLVADEMARRTLLHLSGVAAESIYSTDSVLEFTADLAIKYASGGLDAQG